MRVSPLISCARSLVSSELPLPGLLHHLWGEPWRLGYSSEGVAGLLTLAAMTGVVLSLPEQLWETVAPGALLFPVLLWLAARCRPVFAAAGVLVVSITIAWTTIFDIGHFANTGLTVDYRIMQAQAVILTAAIGAHVLAALFAERSGRAASGNSPKRSHRVYSIPYYVEDNDAVVGPQRWGTIRDPMSPRPTKPTVLITIS